MLFFDSSRLARIGTFAAASEPALILAIAPALLFPTPQRMLVLFLVAATWASIWTSGAPVVPSTPLNVAIWLLLATVFGSMLTTSSFHFGLNKIAGVILGVLLFWSLVRWTTSTPRLRLLALIFAWGGAALAVIGLLGTQFYSTKFPIFWDLTDRLPMLIRGLPGAEEGFNRNAVSGCLLLFVPFQVAALTGRFRRWLSPTRWHRWLLAPLQLCILLLTLGTVVLFQSRSAWLALMVAFCAFLIWYSWITRWLMIALFLALAVLGPQRVFSAPGQFLDLHASDYSVATRYEHWARGVAGIRDFPVTGMGMNGFRRIAPRRYPPVLATSEQEIPHAHNNLLQAALDVGVPGLVAYLAIWLLAVVMLLDVYRRAAEPIYRTLAGALGAGLIAHFLFGVGDAIPLGAKLGTVFWFSLALITALHYVALATGSSGNPAPSQSAVAMSGA